MDSATTRCKKLLVFALLIFIFISSVTSVSAANKKFTDVSQRYLESVDYLTANGLTNGVNDTQFGVASQIKRGDAAIILAKALDLPIEDAPVSGFTDVPARGTEAINALKHAGVINGKSATNFGFNDLLKRGEIALMLTKSSAYNLEGDIENLPFTDVNSRYQGAVAALVEHKITSGKTSTKFGTQDNITRGEYAIFIHRAEMINPYVPIETGMPVNKVWEFSFTDKLDEVTLTNDNIYVMDQDKKKIDIGISTTNAGKTIVIKPPNGNYEKGTVYELHILRGTKYANGMAIEKPIRLDFITARDEVEKGVLNEEIIIVEPELVTAENGQNLVIDKALDEKLAVEDIIIIPSAEFPEGQAKKIVTLKENTGSYSISVEQPDFTELFEELDIYKSFEIKSEHIEVATELDGVRLVKPGEARTAAINGDYDIDFNEEGLIFEFTDVEIGDGEEKTVLDGTFNIAKPVVETDMQLDLLGQVKRYQVIYHSSTALVMDITFPERSSEGKAVVYDETLKNILKNKKQDVKIAKARIPTQVPGLFIQGEFYLQVKYDYSYQPEMSVVFRVDDSKGVIYDGENVRPVTETTPELTASYRGSGVLNASSGAVANIGITAYGVLGAGVEGFAGAKGNLEFYNGINEQQEAYFCYNARFNSVVEGSIFADLIGKRVLTQQLMAIHLPPYLIEENCEIFQKLNVSTEDIKLEPGQNRELQVTGEYMDLSTMKTATKDIANFEDLTVSSSDEDIVKVLKRDGSVILTASETPSGKDAIITIEYFEQSNIFNKPLLSRIQIPVTVAGEENHMRIATSIMTELEAELAGLYSKDDFNPYEYPIDYDSIKHYFTKTVTETFSEEFLRPFIHDYFCECDSYLMPTLNKDWIKSNSETLEIIDNQNFHVHAVHLMHPWDEANSPTLTQRLEFQKGPSGWKLNGWFLKNNLLSTDDAVEKVKQHLNLGSDSKFSVIYSHDNELGDYVIHVYQYMNDDPEFSHNATYGWYGVNPLTGKVYDEMLRKL